MENIKEKFDKIISYVKPWMLFTVIFITTIALRVWYLTEPRTVWWDASFYIGMGKYIFTGGALGAFEMFRPLFLPLILGTSWSLGINPDYVSIFIVFASIVGIFFLVYSIGEKISRWGGVIACAILASSPAFFYFTNIGTTDIPSAFISLLAVYIIMKDKWFWGGFVAGLAFFMRFPHILVLAAILAYTLVLAVYTKEWKVFTKKAIYAFLGASIFVVSFMIFSWIAYGDPLVAIRMGRNITDFSDLTFDYLYYVKVIFAENIFYIFALVGIVASLFFKKLNQNKASILITFCLVIFGIYFTQVPHKEVRYALSFISYASILSGFAISMILRKVNSKVAGIIVVIISGVLFNNAQRFIFWSHHVDFAYVQKEIEYQNFFVDKPGVKVITSYPMFMGVADIREIEVFDNWPDGITAFDRLKNNADYISIDTCMLNCETSQCVADRNVLLKSVRASSTLSYKTENAPCLREIYKINK